MPKKLKPSQEDISQFLDAVKGVKPLQHDKISLTKQKAPPKYKQTTFDDNETEEGDFPHLTQSNYLADIHSDDRMEYKVVGLPNKTLRKLQKGQYNVEEILDLHGMTVDAAEQTVRAFLQHCLSSRIQVGLIIHGKGFNNKAPILKNKLNHWLRDIPGILAFCSASKRHGGLGAVYILFKRT